MFCWGAGLRAHHLNAGAPSDANGRVCGDCHANDPVPDPENTIPVYYLRDDVSVENPCSAQYPEGEDWNGDMVGLDNDGDLLYDFADPDCGPSGLDDPFAAGEGFAARLAIAPNPSSRGTQIVFRLDAASPVVVTVVDLRGRSVARIEQDVLPPGRHALDFDGRGPDGRMLPAGIYGVRVEAGDRVLTGKLALLR
jgi:hypothetical protein